jgi:rhodanese-related sulfurtransferase
MLGLVFRRSPVAGLVLLLVAVVVSLACGGSDEAPAANGRIGVDAGGFTRITPAELHTMLQSKDFPLINVHIPYEGEIEGTDDFIPYDHIAHELGRLPADKSAMVVLYCQSGRMSTDAARALVRLGYTNVWELGGGMDEWRKSGLPLLNRGG